MDTNDTLYHEENGKGMPFNLYAALKATEAVVIATTVATVIVAGSVVERLNEYYKTRQREEERPNPTGFGRFR
jgi:hypothetical protein|tara:strand:+ start:281 stop:499 length:219 start_codon:yes stop_codon:yes gene_type:complete